MSFDFTQFGTMVFGDEEMKRRLPETVYASLKNQSTADFRLILPLQMT